MELVVKLNHLLIHNTHWDLSGVFLMLWVLYMSEQPVICSFNDVGNPVCGFLEPWLV